MIGGTFLSSFTLTELKSIEDKSVLEEVLKAIGSIPLAELLPLTHSLKLTNLTDLALGGKSSLAFRDLDGLGTLAFFLQPEKWASIEVCKLSTMARLLNHDLFMNFFSPKISESLFGPLCIFPTTNACASLKSTLRVLEGPWFVDLGELMASVPSIYSMFSMLWTYSADNLKTWSRLIWLIWMSSLSPWMHPVWPSWM